ncbi:MAG: nucleotidyl transferase AbiEii/AbiGii toxin family protein [Sulfurimonas sp.]|uniref:nucleotidyl transferase AbiEii/AbiGii toxin family protein n=1 Tax=Sulfurimonas sp. TaxID=2022749 RepID=UPI002607142C|nr:nucleotidyl transferase AbiEii/AbiGii toxin family protein [Sulfurimonas sp.]MDD5400983.1 nucleotidyl transferase AbiEii/AbiGii toxin family protein [Sulfurimonas sp.]
MTVNVKNALDKICNNEIFNNELYFVGGTALAYYLNHRISEDIDIISAKTLNHRYIIPSMSVVGAKKLEDENVTALRLAGLFPDEYMIKFVLDNVKLEFFQANRPIQKEILSTATFTNYENSRLKILDVKSVAKLKIVALIMREKSRDLFDFSAILENKVLPIDEIIELFSKVDSKISSVDGVVHFMKLKKEPKNDEAVYLSESDKMDLSFEEIKERVLEKI